MGANHIAARFDPASRALLDGLVPLRYESAPGHALPSYVRAASALRRFANRLVIVQDDVNAFAVADGRSGAVRPVLLPAHESGARVFDDTRGNKHDKLDLEACVTLPDGSFVAFGSGSLPPREQLVVWRAGEAPVVVPAAPLYRALRAAVTRDESRLNVEGAVVCGADLRLFHRANDTRAAGRASLNAIADVDCGDFERWLAGRGTSPEVVRVTTLELGDVGGVPFGFTDAVALDDQRALVLMCAEDTECAIADGAVLGCRVGLLADAELATVDVHDATGRRTLLKLEGIERRPESRTEFDVVVDLDRPAVPAQLGRLVWEWR